MQQREKVLAVVVGGLFLALIAVWGISWVRGAYNQRRNERNALRAKVNRMEQMRAERNTMHANLNRLYEQSLPSDVRKAESLYQTWLSGLVNSPEVSFRKPSVPNSRSSFERSFRRLNFRVEGVATMDQLIKFLHEFYAADHLHKITRLSLMPEPKSRDIRVTMSIEALSLNAAADSVFPQVKKVLVDDLKVDENNVKPQATLAGDLGVKSIAAVVSPLSELLGLSLASEDLAVSPGAKEFSDAQTIEMLCDVVENKAFACQDSPRLKYGDWENYYDKVVRRKFFEPNRRPELSSQRIEFRIGDRRRDRRFSASDPNGNRLKYEVRGKLPPGMTVSDTGKWLKAGQAPTLSWLNQAAQGYVADEKLEPGRHTFTLRVTDDGMPQLSTEQRVSVAFVRPTTPTRPAEFDHARFAFLEGLVQVNGQGEAWITVRTLAKKEDRELTLHAGDERKVGKLEFRVMEIDLDERAMWVVFSDLEGFVPVRLRQSLFDAHESAKRVSKTETSQVVK